MSLSSFESLMLPLYMSLTRGSDQPDLIVSDNNYYQYFEGSQASLKRYTGSDSVSGGFTTLKYKNADVLYDGNSGISANHMYFLNTDYLFYRPHKDRNMVPLDPDRFSVNQDAMVKLIGVAGNMTVSNSFLQGVMTT